MATPVLMPHGYPGWYDSPNRGCASPGDVQFFAPDVEDHQQKRKFDTRPAKRLCRQCPFVRECLDWALVTNQQFGVWGGMDERQRRAIRKCLRGECGNRCTHRFRSIRRKNK